MSDSLETLLNESRRLIDKQQDDIDQLRRDMTNNTIALTRLEQKLESVGGKIDNYSRGINRGLWIIGGGFISSVMAWLFSGGLHR